MSKPILASACLLLGAGALAWWQLTEQEKQPIAPTSTSQTSSSSSSTSPASSSTTTTSTWSQLTDPSIRWQVRVDMLRRLDKSALTAQDIETLYTLLNHRPAPQHAEAWWVVMNEIMEQMRLQAIGPDRYSLALLSILRDRTAPEILRDYAVQHLGQWISPRGADSSNLHEQDLALVQESAHVLGDLVTDPTLAHTSVPGTTLAVLADIQGGGLSQKTLTEVIDKIHPWLQGTLTGENNISQATRSSAINAVGMLQLKQYLPAIRQLALAEQTTPTIRLSSIASLGDLGEKIDLPFLKGLAAGSSKFRFAAQSARKKLSKTLSF